MRTSNDHRVRHGRLVHLQALGLCQSQRNVECVLERSFVETCVHDTHFAIRELVHVASKKDWLAGLEHFDDCSLQVVNFSVNI